MWVPRMVWKFFPPVKCSNQEQLTLLPWLTLWKGHQPTSFLYTAHNHIFLPAASSFIHSFVHSFIYFLTKMFIKDFVLDQRVSNFWISESIFIPKNYQGTQRAFAYVGYIYWCGKWMLRSVNNTYLRIHLTIAKKKNSHNINIFS